MKVPCNTWATIMLTAACLVQLCMNCCLAVHVTLLKFPRQKARRCLCKAALLHVGPWRTYLAAASLWQVAVHHVVPVHTAGCDSPIQAIAVDSRRAGAWGGVVARPAPPPPVLQAGPGCQGDAHKDKAQHPGLGFCRGRGGGQRALSGRRVRAGSKASLQSRRCPCSALPLLRRPSVRPQARCSAEGVDDPRTAAYKQAPSCPACLNALSRAAPLRGYA